VDGQLEQAESIPPIAVGPNEWRIVKTLLQQHLPDFEVWAFGSRARGRPKPFSDLDIAIISERPLGLDRLAALAEDFSESDLPWKVDLVDWATTSEQFRATVRRERVVIQPASANLRREQSTNPT
jgi:predicted nucleotidyltransferase